jgi:hypothetical protein
MVTTNYAKVNQAVTTECTIHLVSAYVDLSIVEIDGLNLSPAETRVLKET